jgi:hypothetical protein
LTLRPLSDSRPLASYLQRLKVPLHDAPHQSEIDAEVSVRQPISHAGDLLPRNIRPSRAGILGELFDGFADDLELADDRILPHAVSEEELLAN